MNIEDIGNKVRSAQADLTTGDEQLLPMREKAHGLYGTALRIGALVTELSRAFNTYGTQLDEIHALQRAARTSYNKAANLLQEEALESTDPGGHLVDGVTQARLAGADVTTVNLSLAEVLEHLKAYYPDIDRYAQTLEGGTRGIGHRIDMVAQQSEQARTHYDSYLHSTGMQEQ